jgi:apolipoprotein N-acyltransferase
VISAQAVPSSGPASGANAAREGAFGGFATPWALLISIAGGAAVFASFPPLDAWPLAVLGPALLVIALTGRSLRASFGCGLLFGLALFVPLLSWLINVAWYAWGALAGAEAVIFAVLCVGQRLLLRLPFWPAAVAGWWVAAEAFRDRWPFAFPWGRLAMSQSVAPDVRWVAIGGAPLLTFLVALTGTMIARAGLYYLGGSDPPQTPPAHGRAPRSPVPPRGGTYRPSRSLWAALAAVVTAGLVLAGGLLPVDPVGGAPTAEVAAIQGNVPRARDLSQLLNDSDVTQNHVAATLKLAAQVKAGRLPAPDVVVWPEDAVGLDPYEYPLIYDEILGTVDAVGRPVLVGEVLENPLRNVGQVWVPGRGPTYPIYVKRQLVPFGEYIPFRGLISSFSSLPSLQPVNYTAGRAPVVFDVGTIKLGDVICYEVGFDNLVRSEVNAGANLLALQSNDADFELDGQLGETEQQTAMARIRAIESDRAVVYASTTGESSIIAPDGALIVNSGVWRQAILEARVPLVSYRTLADRVGAWPEYVIVLLTVLALGWACVISRPRRKGTDQALHPPGVRHFSRPPGLHHVLCGWRPAWGASGVSSFLTPAFREDRPCVAPTAGRPDVSNRTPPSQRPRLSAWPRRPAAAGTPRRPAGPRPRPRRRRPPRPGPEPR